MTIEFASDADAILAMSPGKGDRDFVTLREGEEGVIAITIERINANARTVLSDLVTFTNNGEQTIRDITFAIRDRSEGAEVSVRGDMEGVNLEPGGSVTGLGMTIDTRNFVAPPEIRGTITITTVTALDGGS